ncbi:MAG: hypothetical protein GVY29_08900 [Spirochaetes bacterium]|jgi:DNA-directed RNA polymerase specialized sigma24 family protein|nr:hypothetical protein [Spirochaetota bacterium]
MDEGESAEKADARRRLDRTYRDEKPGFIARLRATGRTLEEAEDLVQDVYAETLAKLWVVPRINNLGGWINTLLKRRLIDLWRHDQVRATSGSTWMRIWTMPTPGVLSPARPAKRSKHESVPAQQIR